MELLWLSGSEVEELSDQQSVNLAVEETFRQHGLGRVEMPAKSYLYFREHYGDLRSMPAYLPGVGMAGVKVVNVHPQNPARGLPTVMASLLLVDPHTGSLLAAMNATRLTDMRTGAAGALAAKYLARKDSKTLGLIGSGRQARTQLLATAELFELEKVLVTSRHRQSTKSFSKEFEGMDIVVCNSYQEACKADIVTTTTPSRKPLVKSEWIEDGTHVTSSSA